MKRISVLFLCLMLVFACCATVSAAETKAAHEDHCLCGGAAVGVGDHTQCENITWSPISQALSDLSKADLGTLPSGNYYLDGNVTVTGVSGIGTYTTSKNIAICLNGYNITNSSNRAFGILRQKSTLTICDCSWDGTSFGGTVTGGGTTSSTGNHGGIVYTHTGAVLNVFGGNFVGKSSGSGAAFGVACDGCGDLNEDGEENNTDKNMAPASVMNLYNGKITGGTVSGSGGAIVQYHHGSLNMYGGTIVGGTAKHGGAISGSMGYTNIQGGVIQGGTATAAGGTLYMGSGTLCVTGGKVIGGTANGVKEEVFLIGQDGAFVKAASFADGLAQAKDSQTQHIRLVQDVQSTATISGTVYIDLAGHDLSGVKVTGTLYGMDSVVNDYSTQGLGKLTCAEGGAAEHSRSPQTKKRYMAIENGDGSVSFHRYYVGITKLTLMPDTVGVGYKAVFAGTDAVQGLLAQEDAFGCHLWISPKVVVTRSYGANAFRSKQEIAFRVNNFLNESKTDAENLERSKMELHADVFLRFQDGSEITSFDTSYTFQEMLELSNDYFEGYSLTQRSSLQGLSQKYSNVMMSWDVSNTHHVSGGMWTLVSPSEFLSKTTTSGNYCYIPSGNYALSGDLDLGGKTLRVDPGKSVSLCLNGHTITNTAEVFKNDGTLNLCDCHRTAQEGTITSSYTSSDPTTNKIYAPILYAYAESETNLYGGKLEATGIVTAAGVIALSHDRSAKPDAPAAVMNMYGGVITGGNSVTSGGLISIWNKATFNMYGGVMENGTSETYGGAVQNSSSFFNLYGGTIRNCSAGTNGGAIQNSGTLTVSGGIIENCTAASSGGGIFSTNQVHISDGIVQNCTAQVQGGGVYVGSSTGLLELSGGQILNNTAAVAGGNVMINSARAEVSGGTVTGGSAKDRPGMGLQKSTVVLSGTPRIVENNGTNLSADFNSVITGHDLQEGASVGVFANIHTKVCEDTSGYGRIFSDQTGYTTRIVDGTTVICPESFAQPIATPLGFTAGFGRSDITPELGTSLGGYSTQATRLATNILDSLYATTVAITDAEGQTVLLITTDLCNIPDSYSEIFRRAIAGSTGVPEGNIILTASHTHSSPDLSYTTNEKNKTYLYNMADKLSESAVQAMADRKTASMQTGSFDIQGMNFYRHYTYTDADGVQQYFGDQFGDPTFNSTTKHVDDVDNTMHMVRFVRDGEDILMTNWRAHPHRTGSSTAGDVSADVIGVMRQAIERDTDMKFVYFQGAAGNVNTVSRISSVNHNLTYTAYGEKMATLIRNNLSCLKTCTAGTLQVDNYTYTAIVDKPTEAEYEKALEVYSNLQAEVGTGTITEQNTYARQYGYTSVYALRAVINRHDNFGDSRDLNLNVITLGKNLGFFSAPNELWDTVSVEVEGASPFATTFCLGYANGHNNYLVYKHSTAYRSYEYDNHRFVYPNTIEDMIAYWKTTLNELYQSAQ